MGENISKKALITAFNKIKSHFLALDSKISQNTVKIAELGEILIDIQNKLFKLQISLNEVSSIGNQGVQSINQSLINQSINHLNSHFSPDSKVEALFQNLTNNEFLIFLTIFQSNYITYGQIANKLNLTLSCIRGYVSEMIRKKTPLVKQKLKSRKVILYVDKEFKTLTSEQKLINLYYKNIDPDQTTLI